MFKGVRDNNKTRKRTRHEHFPKIRYGKPINKQKELDKFYKEVDKYPINKIISLDETSIQPSMIIEYSRCSLGKRCIVKTDFIIFAFMFRHIYKLYILKTGVLNFQGCKAFFNFRKFTKLGFYKGEGN